MNGKSGWAFPLIAAVSLVCIFFALVAGDACAAQINGLVTDSKGDRVAGASVTLYRDGSLYLQTPNNPMTTDVTGYYEFSPLSPGTYSLQADKGGYFSNTEMRVLVDSDLEVNLPIPGYVARPSPTWTTPYVTITPTPLPTPTPVPTPPPTPKPSGTPIPLPTRAEGPGFGLLLALLALAAVVAIQRPR